MCGYRFQLLDFPSHWQEAEIFNTQSILERLELLIIHYRKTLNPNRTRSRSAIVDQIQIAMGPQAQRVFAGTHVRPVLSPALGPWLHFVFCSSAPSYTAPHWLIQSEAEPLLGCINRYNCSHTLTTRLNLHIS